MTFAAAAWGSQVDTVAHVVQSGKSALSSLACTSKTGLSRANSVAGVTIGDLATVGAVATSASTEGVGKTYTASSTSTVASASLLGGVVAVDGIETTATVVKDKTGYHADVDFTFARVVVAGTEVELTGETQIVDVPAVGTLTIAGERTKSKKRAGSASGTAISLALLDGTATIVIGATRVSVVDGTVAATFYGGGYAAQVEVGGVVQAGKTARKSLACEGTNGVDKTNATAAVSLGALGKIGAATATVNGLAGDPSEARVFSEVSEVELNVLGVAALRLVGIRGEVHVVRSADGTVSTDLGASTIAKIQIQPIVGGPIDIPIPVNPNTVIDLPLGLGTIGFLVTEDYKSGNGLAVAAAIIDLPLANVHAVIGSARAAIR